jgi:predicted amino acid racemase
MFLQPLLDRNFQFLNAAVQLHQKGAIDANTYVLDLETVTTNARLLSEKGKSLGVDVIAMTKQVGRNPDFCKAVKAGGISGSVAVDYECGVYSHGAGLKISHIGHLVQIPKSQISRAIALEPALWTIFSLAQAKEIAKIAVENNKVVNVSLRVWDEDCTFYKGHEGGFHSSEVLDVAKQLSNIKNLKLAGVTSFPALLFDKNTNKLKITKNAELIQKVAVQLEELLGYGLIRNMPGTTSLDGIEMLAKAGATQVEPGHGLTGTTPLSAVVETIEKPAIAYVTEVMHHHQGRAFVLGGGLYMDPVLGDIPTKAAVFTDSGDFEILEADMPNPGAIDYYAALSPNKSGKLPPIGSTVIFGFRPQVFVSRGMTVGIENSSTNPRALHHYGSSGAKTLVRDWSK